MHRRRLAQTAAVVALSLGGLSASWRVARRGGEAPPRAGTTPLESPVQQIVVPPAGDPTAISLPVDNAHLIEVDRTGALLVHTTARLILWHQPRAYQDIDGRRREVSVRFDIAGAGAPHLAFGAYNPAFPLVIDLQSGKDTVQP